MIAPPTPCAPRATARKVEPVATPEKSEPAVKITIPPAKSSRLPYRSASEPAVSRKAACVSDPARRVAVEGLHVSSSRNVVCTHDEGGGPPVTHGRLSPAATRSRG